MSEFNWTCPFCQHVQTFVSGKCYSRDLYINIGINEIGSFGAKIFAIGCSNVNCKRVELHVSTGRGTHKNNGNFEVDQADIISRHRLWPESNHKPQPDFIPAQIVQDYVEASRIRDLSPNASATLSRRCIQGMIRNFCGIQKIDLSTR